MTSGQVVMLALAIAAWLLMVLDLFTVVGAEGFGDRDIFLGLRWLLAGVLAFAAWVGVGGIWLTARSQGLLPEWVGTLALLLIPASAAAGCAALYLVSQSEIRWPLVVPLVVPPLLAGFVFALYRPSLRDGLSTAAAQLSLWGTVAVLSVSILALVAWTHGRVTVHGSAARAEADNQQAEATRAANLHKLETLTPDAHLVDWFALLDPQSGVRAEALQAARQLPRRQAELEEGLSYGIPAYMRFLPDLELEPSEQLCTAAAAYLERNAQRLVAVEKSPYQAQDRVEWAIAGARWLRAHGCTCEQGLAAMERSILTYSDSKDRRKVLAALAELKQPG